MHAKAIDRTERFDKQHESNDKSVEACVSACVEDVSTAEEMRSASNLEKHCWYKAEPDVVIQDAVAEWL